MYVALSQDPSVSAGLRLLVRMPGMYRPNGDQAAQDTYFKEIARTCSAEELRETVKRVHAHNERASAEV